MSTAVAIRPLDPHATAVMMLLAQIEPSKTNPRKLFDKAKLAELTESVKKHGVLQPPLVRPSPDGGGQFELVAGERRWRAAKAAGLVEMMTICRPLSDREALEIQVIENLQRADLHPLEEAEGYERLLTEHEYTATTIADKVGKSATYVYARLKLCALTAANRKLFYNGKLNPSTALLLARIPVPELQDEAGKEITKSQHNAKDGMSVHDAIEYVHRHYMLELKRAPFPCGDATLVEGAGTCAACPKRTGNQKELFGDVKSGEICTDTVCFGAKRDAHSARQRLAAEQNGWRVITGNDAKKVLPYDTSEGCDGWIRLDAKCYQDKKNRTYRAILGKAAPIPALVQLESGVMIEVVRVSEIADTLKAKGIKSNLSERGGVSRDKTAEIAAQRETEVRTAIFTAVRVNYPPTLDRESLSTIAGCWLDHCGSDSQRAICKGWGWKYGDYKDREHITKNLVGLDDKMLIALLFDLTLIGDVKCHTHHTGKGERLMATAKRVKVDAAQIRATVTQAQKAADAAKAAKKKAADAARVKATAKAKAQAEVTA
jgi:ParB/RepB/Spo0J family partition protein